MRAGRAVTTIPETAFRSVPVPVLVVGLFAALEALVVFYFANTALAEAAYGPPFPARSIWLGTGVVSVGRALRTANLALALLLWGSYRVTPAPARQRRTLQISYVSAVLLLAALQWACRGVTLSLPRWTLLQIYP